ncbi:MAG: Polysaccharide biosynthesis protein [Thermoleophilia bacterium]|nr:Polysaccharide biosynthesis protein [Thermoleophilia bacterium]
MSSRLALDAVMSVGARLVAMVASSITAIVIIGALTKSEYGAYAIVIGINVVLVGALDLGLTSSISRFIAQGRATTRLVAIVATLRILLSGVGALLLLVAMALPQFEGEAWTDLLPAAAVLLLANSFVAFQYGTLPALQRIRLLVLLTVLQPAAELILVLGVRARGGDAADMLLAGAIAAGGAGILAWLFILLVRGGVLGRARETVERADAAIPPVTLSDVATYGRRIFVVSLLMLFIGQVDQFIIAAFHGAAAVAPYAVVLKLQALITAPALTITSIVAPRIAGAGAAALATYRQWLAFLIVLHLGAVLVVGVLASEAFGAIDAQYRNDAGILLAMLGYLLFASIAALPSVTMNQTGLATARLRIAAITLTINLVLDLALVPWLGAYGAAIGTTAAYGYYVLRHHLLLERSLAADAVAPVAPLRPLLVRGAIGAATVAAIAATIAALMRIGDRHPSDVTVFLVAALVAAVLHTWWCTRLVRSA